LSKIGSRWAILATAFLILFFSGGSRFLFGFLLIPISDDLSVTRTTLSGAATVFMVVSAISMPIFGRLLDKYDMKWVLGIAAILGVLGLGLMGIVTKVWHIFLIYGVLYAIGNAGTSTSPIGLMVSRFFEKRKGIAISSALSGNAIGQLIIISSFTSVITTISWRASYAIIGMINFVTIVPLIFFVLNDNGLERSRKENKSATEINDEFSDTKDDRSGVDSLKIIFTSRQLWLLVVLYFVCGFQDFFMGTHVVAFASDQGVSEVLAGQLLAMMGFMTLVGVLCSGFLSDAYGASRPTIICFIIRVFLFILIIISKDISSIIIFALAYGFTFAITAPLTVIFSGNIFGSARLGTVSGFINMVHQIAGGIGALAGGILFDVNGNYDAVFVLMFVLSIIALVVSLMVKEKRFNKT